MPKWGERFRRNRGAPPEDVPLKDPSTHEGIPEFDIGVRIVERLLQGRTLADLDVDRINGRVDLRGFVFPQPIPSTDPGAQYEVAGVPVREHSRTLRFEGSTWRSLDLTDATIGHVQLMGVEMSDCALDGADLRGTRFFGAIVEDSSFVAANLKDIGFGGSHNGRFSSFERCDFTRARMDRNWYGPASFTDCDFSGAQLKKSEFWACTFVRCRFAGKFDEVIFHRKPMRRDPGGAVVPEPRLDELDLRGVHFEWSGFDGFDLDGVLLPDQDPDLLVIENWDGAIDRGLLRLDVVNASELWRRVARSQLEVFRRDTLSGTKTGLFNQRDYQQAEFGEGFSDFLLGLLK